MGVKTYHVGVDLHRNNFTYCVRDSNGEETVGKEEISCYGKRKRGVIAKKEADSQKMWYCKKGDAVKTNGSQTVKTSQQ